VNETAVRTRLVKEEQRRIIPVGEIIKATMNRYKGLAIIPRC